MSIVCGERYNTGLQRRVVMFSWITNDFSGTCSVRQCPANRTQKAN